ncbi:MAG: hypothetical protein HOV71_09300 [Hamadaea sp.]|nr:hypothetical protein [Hamadaea sp.]NUT08573.1 hypothetical protein [Hamadaea sp.]
MSDLDERQDHLVRLLAPRYQVPQSVGEPTGPVAQSLLTGIMHTAPAEAEASAVRRRPLFTWRRLAFGVPVAAALAAVALSVTAALPPSGPGGPTAAQAGALEIAQQDGYVVVKILDPVADPQRYRAELARHGLDIELTLAPAEPDQVGKIIFLEVGDSGAGPKLEVVEAPGRCAANGNCAVGLRVPANFPSYAHIVIGRTPRPGEQVTGDAPVLSQAEKDRLRALVGKTVAEARTALAALGMTIEYRVGGDSHAATADQVPGTWVVFDVAPLTMHSVALWSSPTGTPASPAPASIGQ